MTFSALRPAFLGAPLGFQQTAGGGRWLGRLCWGLTGSLDGLNTFLQRAGVGRRFADVCRYAPLRLEQLSFRLKDGGRLRGADLITSSQ